MFVVFFPEEIQRLNVTCTVGHLSTEELNIIQELKSSKILENRLQFIHKSGPMLVNSRDGAIETAYHNENSQQYRSPSLPLDVIHTERAGDEIEGRVRILEA